MPGELPRVEGVPDESYLALASRYGHAAEQVLALAAERGELAQPVVQGLPDLLAEAPFAARCEQARGRRRRPVAPHALGTAGRQGAVRYGSEIPARVAQAMGSELGWSAQRVERETKLFGSGGRGRGHRLGRAARASDPMRAPARRLLCARGTLELGGRPWLMGIINATPDSFSDTTESRTFEARIRRAQKLLESGADVIDIGGESGVTNRPAVAPEEEAARILPLIECVAGELGALVSVDTYKPSVARAAIAAGAALVNDVSGLRDPELADVCAETGAGLVVMHTTPPLRRSGLDPSLDGRVAQDAYTFLQARMELACERGVGFEQMLLDPGPDFGKTPAQTVEVLRELSRFHELGLPLLLAASRKDFVGALTGRPPAGSAGWNAGSGGLWRSRPGPHPARPRRRRGSRFPQGALRLQGESELDMPARLEDRLRWETQD